MVNLIFISLFSMFSLAQDLPGWTFHPENPESVFFVSSDPAFKGTLTHDDLTMLVLEFENSKDQENLINQRLFQGQGVLVQKKDQFLLFQIRENQQTMKVSCYLKESAKILTTYCSMPLTSENQQDLKKIHQKMTGK